MFRKWTNQILQNRICSPNFPFHEAFCNAIVFFSSSLNTSHSRQQLPDCFFCQMRTGSSEFMKRTSERKPQTASTGAHQVPLPSMLRLQAYRRAKLCRKQNTFKCILFFLRCKNVFFLRKNHRSSRGETVYNLCYFGFVMWFTYLTGICILPNIPMTVMYSFCLLVFACYFPISGQ